MRRAGLAIDVVSVLVFVVIGRAAHDHGESVAGIISTAWPFVSGMAAGHVLVAVRRRDASGWRGGAVVWLATVAVGMALRVIAGQGIAFAFVLVALCFLGAMMLGGRALAGIVRRATMRATTA